jgi:hypothetical protein
MEKFKSLIEIIKKHWKFIMLYHLSLTFVSHIFLTEVMLYGRLSLAMYCIFGSTAALTALIHRMAKDSFNEGYQEGYQEGTEAEQLDAEIYWKNKYDELFRIREEIIAYPWDEAS